MKQAPVDGFQLIRGGTIVIDAPDYLGTFNLDAQSHLFRRLAQSGSFEPACAAAVKRLLPLDRDAIDVGANIGFFSVLFGKLLGPSQRILAIEPIPHALKFLQTNIDANGLTNKVKVFEGAAGESRSTQTMEFVSGREEYSALRVVHPSVAADHKTKVNVIVETIDALVEVNGLNPGFIKLDVEGSEVSALRGAHATISHFRPRLLVEYAPSLLQECGSSGAELLQLLRAHDYDLKWLSEGEVLALPR